MSDRPKIKTDETFCPGYVWFDCNYYGLPDNTAGEIGYHSTYRPLCGNMYTGNELVAEQMQADLREFYVSQEAIKVAADKAKSEATLAEIRESPKEARKIKVPAIAIAAYNTYKGNAERAWEAEDEQAYSLINQYRDAIEAQGMTHPQAVRDAAAELARSKNLEFAD